MELSILLAEQIFSLLLMVLTGYVVRKLNVVPKSGRKVLASIVLYVSAPCIVFDSFQIEYSSEKLFSLVVGFAAACTGGFYMGSFCVQEDFSFVSFRTDIGYLCEYRQYDHSVGE